MKEVAVIIIILSLIKLTSYGIWNVNEDKNISGAVGTGILGIALIAELAALIVKL